MKSTYIFVLTMALVVYCAPAMAQHGHPGGMGGGMGGGASAGMGHGQGHNAGAAGMASSSSHGKTMDQILSKNTQLSDKIAKLTGMSSQDACAGFKNLGQCVAAAHVSKNLGISFACLKADMTGTAAPQGTSCPAAPSTKSKSMSLGQAIQTLSPNSNSKAETKKATHQADQDIKETNS